MAQLAEALDPEPEPESAADSDNLAVDLYSLHEVLAMERKKCESKQNKARETPQPAPSNTAVPTAPSASHPPPTASRPSPQFRYQSNTEDQKLMAELRNWLLEGKLTLTTPAHILAASQAI